MTVFLGHETKEMEREQLTTTMRLAPFTKSVRFISKETAAAEHSASIGEDFMNFLGYNPLQDALDIRLKAEFVTTEVLDSLSDVIEKKPFISEILYDRPLIVLLNQNIERFGFWLLICSSIFVAIALLLINHSIKLSIFSKRLVIQTMLLVGARKRFIRRPFLWRYMLLGVISAVLALAGFTGLLSFLVNLMPQVDWWGSIENIALLSGGILLCSVLISVISAFFATQRHLKLTYEIVY
jgi:cell division transport system permease protein